MDAKRKDLLEKRAQATDAGRAILKRAKDEGRALTDDERSQSDKHLDDALDYDKQIRDHDADLERERRQAEADARIEENDRDRDRGRRTDPTSDAESRALAAFGTFTQRGWGALGDAERRDLQADSLGAGGALILSMALSSQFIQAVDDQVFVRRYATIETVMDAESLGAAALDADPADPDWTSEVASIGTDTTMALGRRELKPNQLAKELKVSQRLLRKSMRAGALVLERLAYKNAVAQEKGFLTGTGSLQPLGVFTASTSGISTGRDESTGNTTTAVTADGIINAKYKLKGGYWNDARWIFHRDIMKQIAKLADSTGQFLWRQSLRDGEPDTLAGFPVDMSEFAPSTSTTGLYVGALCSWKRGFMIADSVGLSVQRLDELYAKTSQVGFISRSETDGMPVLEDAFVRVKLA